MHSKKPLMDQEKIVEKIRNGDMAAFKTFADHYYPRVLRTVTGFLHEEEDARDLSQEIFIELYQSIHKFRKESRLSTWVYRIAVNKSLNYIRDNKRRKMWQSIENVFAGATPQEVPAYVSADDSSSVESRERAAVIHQAMDSLPKNQKIAFTLSKYDELPNKQIAEIMNLSVSAVESLIHRAKLGLQKKLTAYFEKK